MEFLRQFSQFLTDSVVREHILYLLMNVPGLPPIVQTVHIVCICLVMASIVIINLRFLNLIAPSQSTAEMITRLMPWMWWALLLALLSGWVFVMARPARYIFNPIVAWKLTFLVPAISLAALVHGLARRHEDFWEHTVVRLRSARMISLLSLGLWTGVVLAGRWIAYADYIYWE